MNKKKVDVVVKYFYPVAAGIENNVMQVYSVLARNGWEVTIHTSRDTYTEKNVLAERERMNGLYIKRYSWNPLIGFWPKINWKTERVVCLHNFNIVPHLIIFLYTLILKGLRKKKFALFVVPHGGYSPEWRIFNSITRIIKKLYHETLGMILMNWSVDGIRTVSYWEKEDMVRAGIKKEKIRPITNGLEKEAYKDIDMLASEEAKEKVKILGDYIIQGGRIYGIKNQETTIRALSLIKSNLKFVMLGPCQDTEYKERLDKLIQELDLEDRVVFLGVVRGVDKYYYLKNAKAMVHMALWEGNCNFVHEGWSQNLICIVANSLGLNEQIKNGQNGFLVEEKDYRTLAQKIQYVLDNHTSKELNSMRDQNLLYVINNSWEKVAHRVGKFYASKLPKAIKHYDKNRRYHKIFSSS